MGGKIINIRMSKVPSPSSRQTKIIHSEYNTVMKSSSKSFLGRTRENFACGLVLLGLYKPVQGFGFKPRSGGVACSHFSLSRYASFKVNCKVCVYACCSHLCLGCAVFVRIHLVMRSWDELCAPSSRTFRHSLDTNQAIFYSCYFR